MARLLRERQACGIRRERGEHLSAFAVRNQHDAAFAILVEEALARSGGSPRNRGRATRWSAPAPAARRSSAASRHRARGECCARFRARVASRPGGPACNCCKTMPAAKMISGSVVPATRRARRTGSESFGNASPGSAPNCRKHRRSGRIPPRILEGYWRRPVWRMRRVPRRAAAEPGLVAFRDCCR